jgi:hypothetical protein
MSKQVDFLIKVRESAQILADAANEYLESLAPPEVRGEKSQRPEAWTDRVGSWNPEHITWIAAQGDKGAYEKADVEHNSSGIDFSNLLKDLQEHKDSLTRNNLYYWKFTTGQVVGRKPSRRS